MGWFYMYLSWILVSAAVIVSCQELTTLLPQDDDACMRNEVTFSCTVRGSQTLTDLILAWRSPEYIGDGNVLRLLSDNTPGTNTTSDVNENVIAVLTKNTMMGGVPVLVSELRIIGANQTSVITCESVTSGRLANTEFDSSAFPGRPQRGEARERTPGSCDFLVAWDPPTNIDRLDIGSYRVYVPSRNIMNVSLSNTIDLTIPNCRSDDSIQVAAVNRLKCVGPNSSLIPLSLMEVPTTQDAGLSHAAIIAISTLCVLIALVVLVGVILFVVLWKVCGRKKKAEESRAIELESINKKVMKEKFKDYLKRLYEALRQSACEIPKEAVIQLLEWEKNISSRDIQKALSTTLDLESIGIQHAFHQMSQKISKANIDIDAKLNEVGESSICTKVTMEDLKEAATKSINDLKKQVEEASSEDVKNVLRILLEALQECLIAAEVQEVLVTLRGKVTMCKKSHIEIKAILQRTIGQLEENSGTGESPDGHKRADTWSYMGSSGKQPHSGAKKPKGLKKQTTPDQFRGRIHTVT